MGAIASGGAQVLNELVIHEAGVSDETIEEVAAREREEVARRELLYRGERVGCINSATRPDMLVCRKIAFAGSKRT